MARSGEKRDDTESGRTRRALEFAYRYALPRLRAERHANTGFSAPSYNRLVSRNYEFYAQLCRDLATERHPYTDEAVLELKAAEDQERMGSWRRVERSLLMDAAADLIFVVDGLPEPVREAIVLHAMGLSPRQVARRLGHRASFSVADDLRRGLLMIWASGSLSIGRIV